MEKAKTERLVALEQNRKKKDNPFLLSPTVDAFDGAMVSSLPSCSKGGGCISVSGAAVPQP